MVESNSVIIRVEIESKLASCRLLKMARSRSLIPPRILRSSSLRGYLISHILTGKRSLRTLFCGYLAE